MPFSRWICSALLAAVSVAPVLAGTKDATDAKTTPEATATASPAAQPTPAAASPTLTPAAGTNTTALLGVLVMKGVLSPAEAKSIEAAPAGSEVQLLVDVLTRKGVVSASDLAVAPAASPVAVPAAEAAPATVAVAVATAQPAAVASPAPQAAPKAEAAPAPAVVPAIAPVRFLPLDPPKTGGLAGLKLGPVTFAPYGFIKATAVHDTSAPDGDDFPFIGLWFNSTEILNAGPNGSPAFHIKARSSRIGANFEWPDISPKLTLTGRIEADFENNFSVVDNADASSIRNPSPRLRLGYVRLDYHSSDRTDFFFQGGQDWSLFGSGALPNILETTFLGAFYGDIYTRTPQFTIGFSQSLGTSPRSFKFSPAFALMMPSTGDILKLQDIPSPSNGTGFLSAVGLNNQLGQGEDEGAFSGRPELEGKLTLQFQLDPAPGVAPAQVFVSGFESRRTAITTSSNGPVPLATTFTEPNGTVVQGSTPVAEPASYLTAFPNGFTASSNMYGLQAAVQLPTRWFTLVASAYRGADLRFFAGGQFNSYAADIAGLTNPITFTTTDGGPFITDGTNILGCQGTFNAVTGACSGSVVVAPQKPIRAFGGFVNLGLPLSRWFNANPNGHNAGWQLLFDIGKDQANNHDINNPYYTGVVSPLPLAMGKMFAATLYYRFNRWCTFGFEQSNYATRVFDHLPLYVIGTGANGLPKTSNEWKDQRTEFGPVFTF